MDALTRVFLDIPWTYELTCWARGTITSNFPPQSARAHHTDEPKFYMKSKFNKNLFGNEVYFTNSLILLVENMLCSKLHC